MTTPRVCFQVQIRPERPSPGLQCPTSKITDEGLILDALPATLTDAGASASATYPAVESLDPIRTPSAMSRVELLTRQSDQAVAECENLLRQRDRWSPDRESTRPQAEQGKH